MSMKIRKDGSQVSLPKFGTDSQNYHKSSRAFRFLGQHDPTLTVKSICSVFELANSSCDTVLLSSPAAGRGSWRQPTVVPRRVEAYRSGSVLNFRTNKDST